MRRPVSTYRLQMHAKFGFVQANECLPYLDMLGVSDIYSSPYLKAGRGSMHGYDVVNPTVLNDELGAVAAHQAFSDEMRKRGLGHVLDIVPNHMSTGEGNEWWWDVLENGPSSPYANHFDIDWDPPKATLQGRVLLPVLGGQFSELLERGELKLTRDGALLALSYYDHHFPIAPKTLGPLLTEAVDKFPEEPARQELRSIVRALENLPDVANQPRTAQLARNDEILVIRRRLSALLTESKPVADAIDAVLASYNGKSGEPASFDRLEQLISAQNYRLADWHVAAEEINYRRFFDINQLVALRMEDPEVFAESHAFILKLLKEGRASGVRLDHTDGLRDPDTYFARLREHAGRGDFYIVAEKILGAGEQLPTRWPIDGTTGYDFMIALGGLFVDAKGEGPLTALYQEFTGDKKTFEEHARDARRLIMRASLPSEVHTLSRALESISEKGRRPHDFTTVALQTAITETVAAFPVYRTYLRDGEPADETDRKIIEGAIATARERNPEISSGLFDFLRDVLLLEPLPGADEEVRKEQVKFALRFQQLTPPMMAKGVEDTAFYTYRRLLVLNDVGGDPGRFGTSIAEFHQQNQIRRRDWPLTMLASSTHDNKRGEDVRARLSVLSEIPEEWGRAVAQWSELLAPKRKEVTGALVPGRDDEYLFYQTVVGVFPFNGNLDETWVGRIAAYMIKAARETKAHTSWTKPVEEYEKALEAFVRDALGDTAFRDSLSAFARKILPAGALNGLSQVALKLCSPGVADTYQGCEQWNLSLVDPDNRRPVDYKCLTERLEKIRARIDSGERVGLCKELLGRYGDSDIKQYVTHMLLRARRRDAELFLDGDYRPLDAGENVVAFVRTVKDRKLICAVPRRAFSLMAVMAQGHWPLGPIWKDQTLPIEASGELRSLITGEALQNSGAVRLADLFATFPIAVLISEPR